MQVTVQASRSVKLDRQKVQIIIAALIVGLAGFSGVAVWMAGEGGLGNDASLAPILRAALLVLGFGLVAASRVVKRVMLGKPSGSDDPAGHEAALASRLTLTVVQAAFADGFGLCGSVFLLVTGQLYFLAAPAISILIMLKLLPGSGASAEPPAIGRGASSHSQPIDP